MFLATVAFLPVMKVYTAATFTDSFSLLVSLWSELDFSQTLIF